MPRVTWPLLNDRPAVRIDVTLSGQLTTLDLHADTGAGAASSAFDLLLFESDCWLCGSPTGMLVELTGAYVSAVYYYQFRVRVRIPVLAFDDELEAVGVPFLPTASGASPASAC